MKWIYRSLILLGFTFQYIIPLILFGGVIPYTHDGIAAGLTKMGYIAIAVGILIVCSKLERKLEALNDGILKELLKSIFPIGKWLIVGFALSWVTDFVDNLTSWWWDMIIFIIIGRLFYIAASEFRRRSVTNGES